MPIIEVNHVTKEYQLEQLQSLQHSLQPAATKLRGQPAPECSLFKSLDNISFSIEQGEMAGIIGRNTKHKVRTTICKHYV